MGPALQLMKMVTQFQNQRAWPILFSKGRNNMSKKLNFTVIGAGHGGKAMAAHLALMDFPVTLYNRTADHIEAIKELHVIDLTSYVGGPRGAGKLECVTSNIAEALEHADMIMVVVP